MPRPFSLGRSAGMSHYRRAKPALSFMVHHPLSRVLRNSWSSGHLATWAVATSASILHVHSEPTLVGVLVGLLTAVLMLRKARTTPSGKD